jgi:hypothetical protein
MGWLRSRWLANAEADAQHRARGRRGACGGTRRCSAAAAIDGTVFAPRHAAGA